MYVGKQIFSIPRVRKTIRSGISHSTYLEKNNYLIRVSTLFARYINYQGILGMQFKENFNGKPMILNVIQEFREHGYFNYIRCKFNQNGYRRKIIK